jgi:hypothetical protein
MKNPFKRLNYWFQTLIYSLVFTAVLLLVFKIASPFHRVYDLSSLKRFSFTEETVTVVKQVGKRPVQIIGFFNENDPDIREIESFTSSLQNTLPQLKFSQYDLEKDPDKAKEYQVHETGTLLVELEGRRSLILSLNDEGMRRGFEGVLTEKQPLIFFTTGHREVMLDDTGLLGYSFFKDRLENGGYVMEQGSLDSPLIDQADLVVIAYPKKDFHGGEISHLKELLKTKNIIFMIDPEVQGTYENLRGLLLELGIALGDDVVLDRTSRTYGADDLIPVVNDFTHHDIVTHFDIPIFFPLTRSLKMIESGESSIWGKDYLIFSGKDSWGESDYESLEAGSYSYSETEDVRGPLALAIALERKSESQNRILVFGDSDFANNTNFNAGANRLLILNAVSWVLGEELIYQGKPEKEQSEAWVLSPENKVPLLLYMIALPSGASFLILGFIFILRRKSA